MNITKVSEKYGLTADTLRYYERIGLIPPVHRNKSGVRDYQEEDIRWVEFIRCMRSAGISIEALIEYVGMFKKGHATAEARKELLMEQRKQLADRVRAMQETLARLDEKIENYDKLMLQAEESHRL